MEKQELLAQMEKLAAAGDEKAFESFVLDHFEEFPEDVQGKILMSFYSETLEKQAGAAAIANLQKEGIDALKEIEKIKSEVESGQ